MSDDTKFFFGSTPTHRNPSEPEKVFDVEGQFTVKYEDKELFSRAVDWPERFNVKEMSRELDRRLREEMLGTFEVTGTVSESKKSPPWPTVAEIDTMLAALPVPPRQRVVPVQPFFITVCYTGHDELQILEDNPVYHTIAPGKSISFADPFAPNLTVHYVRADEWRKTLQFNADQRRSYHLNTPMCPFTPGDWIL